MVAPAPGWAALRVEFLRIWLTRLDIEAVKGILRPVLVSRISREHVTPSPTFRSAGAGGSRLKFESRQRLGKAHAAHMRTPFVSPNEYSRCMPVRD